MSTVKPRSKAKGINIPNVLTYVRIAAVPIVVFLLLWPEQPTMRWTAFGIFTIAALTDYLDGYLARLWSQQTTMGRMLDPVADKLIVAACLLMLCVDGTIHSWWVWAAVIILCREILVSGLREFLAELNVSVPVSRVAKWKTAAQLMAIGFLIAGQAGEKLLPGTVLIGLILLVGAAVLTLYTGYDYFRAGVKHLLDDDGETGAGET